MSELVFGFILTAAIMLVSWVLGDWKNIFPKRKNTYTVKYGDEKITFNRKTGKITKHG
jgi:hypothetical protein